MVANAHRTVSHPHPTENKEKITNKNKKNTGLRKTMGKDGIFNFNKQT